MANSKITVESLNLHYGENHALKNVNMEIGRSCHHRIYRSQWLRQIHFSALPEPDE